MRVHPLSLLMALAPLVLPGCGKGDAAEATTGRHAAPLTITGQADAASFGAAVATVRATRAGAVVAQAAIGPDGRFTLAVPAGAGYTLDFIHPGGTVALVFPRKTGVIEHRFDVTGGGAFDLGVVRHVGDPSVRAYHFSTALMSLSEADDLECEDGVDAATGAMCVDDDEEELAGLCGGGAEGEHGDGDEADGVENDGEENDGAGDEADGVDCVDGIDAATGAACDGGPAANPDDGEENDGEENDGEENDGEEEGGADATPTDAAVADHNLPSALGCAGLEEDDEGGVDCEDGIDRATGLECDGGPAANR